MKQGGTSQAVQKAQALLGAGLRFHGAGQLAEAEKTYRAALAVVPDHPDVLHMLGVVKFQIGQFDESAELIKAAISLKQNYPQALYNLANTRRAQGRRGEAMEGYRKAVELKPDYVDAYNNLGLVLREQGLLEEAAGCFKSALSLSPDLLEARANLADCLLEMCRFEEAAEHFEKAVAASPENVDALIRLGKCLEGMTQNRQALACYDRALAIDPQTMFGRLAKVSLLNRLRRHDEAVELLEQAIEVEPDNALLHNLLGLSLMKGGDLEAARAAVERTLSLAPDNAEILANLGAIYRDLFRPLDSIKLCKKAVAADPSKSEVWAIFLSAMNYLPGYPREEMFESACAFGESMAKAATPYLTHGNDRSPDRTLRVGMVSGDFCMHPVGFYLLGSLMDIDPERVSLFAYNTNDKDDEVARRLKSKFTGWRDVRMVSDSRLAEMIVEDRIDILIDLAGHTDGNRLPVFAWKPAPVQAAWAGYVATTGVREIDYILCDEIVMPPEEERYFVEKPYRLADSYLCSSMPNLAIGVGPLPADRNGYITFGSFNNLVKASDDLIAYWADLLQAVPDSKLFLKNRILDASAVRDKVFERFLSHGIASDRLILEGASPRPDLIGSYNKVDIALDTFPYTGGVTSIEAMWMGVPVLTLGGNSFSERVGETIIANVGLADWVVHSPEQYVRCATRHASDLDSLRTLRQTLRNTLMTSPVADSQAFSRKLEKAFRGMWEDWCRSGR